MELLEPVQVFTRDLSGTGPDRIRYWTCKTAGTVLDPFRTGSRTVPCKQKAYPVRKLDRIRSGPVPCKHSLTGCLARIQGNPLLSMPRKSLQNIQKGFTETLRHVNQNHSNIKIRQSLPFPKLSNIANEKYNRNETRIKQHESLSLPK